MSDAITLLTEDHRRVEQLFDQFAQTGDFDVALKVCLELTVHATIEEELLYGLYSAKVDNAGAAEARAEHQQAKDIIMRVEAMEPGSQGLADAMAELRAAVTHHVEEEENVMFPKLLARLPDTAGVLGPDLAARRTVVEAQVVADRQVGMLPSTTGQKNVTSPEPGW